MYKEGGDLTLPRRVDRLLYLGEVVLIVPDCRVISSGKLVFQGPREFVLPFFTGLGFECPPLKGTADFLQEVNTFTDQEVGGIPAPLSFLYLIAFPHSMCQLWVYKSVGLAPARWCSSMPITDAAAVWPGKGVCNMYCAY